MAMIRIKDIAEKAGVSPTTVSNVIHGNTKKVSKETIERIQGILKEFDYVPSMSARMLAENRSRLIGVMIGGGDLQKQEGSQRGFTDILIKSLESEIYKKNYYMLFHLSGSPEESLQIAATWNVEGLITIGLTAQDNYKIQSRCSVPVVSIDTYYEAEKTANVGLDDSQGGYEMTRFLLEHGHRGIAFLADNDFGVDHFRWIGAKNALDRFQVPYEEKDSHIIIPRDRMERFEFYHQNMEVLAKRDALFFASDYYAAEAVMYLRDRGIEVPQDVSVAGFDDSEYARMCRPELTTIHQDMALKGETAVEKLFAYIEGEKEVCLNTKLPVRLVVRKSVKLSSSCKK